MPDETTTFRVRGVLEHAELERDVARTFDRIRREMDQMSRKRFEVGGIDKGSLDRIRTELSQAVNQAIGRAPEFQRLPESIRKQMEREVQAADRLVAKRADIVQAERKLAEARARAIVTERQGYAGEAAFVGRAQKRDLDPTLTGKEATQVAATRQFGKLTPYRSQVAAESAITQAETRLINARNAETTYIQARTKAAAQDTARAQQQQRQEEIARGRGIIAIEKRAAADEAAARRASLQQIGLGARAIRAGADPYGLNQVVGGFLTQRAQAAGTATYDLPYDTPDTTHRIGRLQETVNQATIREAKAREEVARITSQGIYDERQLRDANERLRRARLENAQAQRTLGIAQAPVGPPVQPKGFAAQFGEGFRGASDLPYAQQVGQAFKFSVFYGTAYNLLFAFTQTLRATVTEGIEFQETISELKLATGRSRDAATDLANRLGMTAADAGFSPAEGATAGARAIGLYGATTGDTATQNYIAQLSTDVATKLSFNAGKPIEEMQTRLAAITNAFELGFAGQGQVADLDAYLSKRFGVAPGETIQTIAESGSVGNQAGFNLQEVGAIAALMQGRTGVSGSTAAGYLAQIFSRGGEGTLRSINERYGVDNNQLLADQIRELAEVYKRAPESERTAIAAAFGRGKVQNAVSVLLANFDDVAAAAGDAADGLAEGASDKAFNERMNNIGGQLQLLMADLKEFANQFGQSGLLATIGIAAEGFGELVESTNSLLRLWNQLDGGLKAAVASLGLFTLATRTQAGQSALAGTASFLTGGAVRRLPAGERGLAGAGGFVGGVQPLNTRGGLRAAGAGLLRTAGPWAAALGGLWALGEMAGHAQKFNAQLELTNDALTTSTDELEGASQWAASAEALREQADALRDGVGFWTQLASFGQSDDIAERNAQRAETEADRQDAIAEAQRRASAAAVASNGPPPLITGLDTVRLEESMEAITEAGGGAQTRLDALRVAISGAGEAADSAAAAFSRDVFAGEAAQGVRGNIVDALTDFGANSFRNAGGDESQLDVWDNAAVEDRLREMLDRYNVDSELIDPTTMNSIAEDVVDEAVFGGGEIPEGLAGLRQTMVGEVYRALSEQTADVKNLLDANRKLTGEEVSNVIAQTLADTQEALGNLAESDFDGRVEQLRKGLRDMLSAAANTDSTLTEGDELGINELRRQLVEAEVARLENLRIVAQQNAESRAEAAQIGRQYLRREVAAVLKAGGAGADVLAEIIRRTGDAGLEIVRQQLDATARAVAAAKETASRIRAYSKSLIAQDPSLDIQEGGVILKKGAKDVGPDIDSLLDVLNTTPTEGTPGLGSFAGTDVPGYEAPEAPKAGKSAKDLEAERKRKAEEAKRRAEEARRRGLAIRASLRLLSADITDPLVEARIAVADALDQVKHATDRESRLAARVDLRRARNNLESTKFQQRLQSVQTAEELGRISHRKYISYLDSERRRLEAIKNRTYQQQQQLDEVERLLQTSAESMEGQWNFGDINLPTPYQVRRRVQEVFGDVLDASAGVGGNREVRRTGDVVTINIDGADTGKVLRVIKQYVGSNRNTRIGTRHR